MLEDWNYPRKAILEKWYTTSSWSTRLIYAEWKKQIHIGSTPKEKKIQSMTHRYWRRDSIETSETVLQRNRVHKPWRTGMIIRQPIKFSITNEGENLFNMGRWSYSTIRGRNKRRVTVIATYQTYECNMTTQGVTTFSSQIWTLLDRKDSMKMTLENQW